MKHYPECWKERPGLAALIVAQRDLEGAAIPTAYLFVNRLGSGSARVMWVIW